MDLEMIVLSEVRQESQIFYDISYMWNLKWYNDLTYKTETDSWTLKTNLWYQKGREEDKYLKTTDI